jgi:hypothetical protein
MRGREARVGAEAGSVRGKIGGTRAARTGVPGMSRRHAGWPWCVARGRCDARSRALDGLTQTASRHEQRPETLFMPGAPVVEEGIPGAATATARHARRGDPRAAVLRRTGGGGLPARAVSDARAAWGESRRADSIPHEWRHALLAGAGDACGECRASRRRPRDAGWKGRAARTPADGTAAAAIRFHPEARYCARFGAIASLKSVRARPGLPAAAPARRARVAPLLSRAAPNAGSPPAAATPACRGCPRTSGCT